MKALTFRSWDKIHLYEHIAQCKWKVQTAEIHRDRHFFFKVCDMMSSKITIRKFKMLYFRNERYYATRWLKKDLILGILQPHKDKNSEDLATLVWIDHFTVVCLVAWPLNESEAGVDLVLIETLLLFICKFLLISIRTASLTWEKQGGFYQNKVTSSLTFIHRPGN